MPEPSDARNAAGRRAGIWCRLIRSRQAVPAAVPLAKAPIRRVRGVDGIQLRRRGRVRRAAVLHLRISARGGGCRIPIAAEVPGRVGWCRRGDGGGSDARVGARVVVHGDQNRGCLQKLDLLVLGNQELGSVGPFGSVLPPERANKSTQVLQTAQARIHGR